MKDYVEIVDAAGRRRRAKRGTGLIRPMWISRSLAAARILEFQRHRRRRG
jgi:hypothetical protein